MTYIIHLVDNCDAITWIIPLTNNQISVDLCSEILEADKFRSLEYFYLYSNNKQLDHSFYDLYTSVNDSFTVVTKLIIRFFRFNENISRNTNVYQLTLQRIATITCLTYYWLFHYQLLSSSRKWQHDFLRSLQGSQICLNFLLWPFFAISKPFKF